MKVVPEDVSTAPLEELVRGPQSITPKQQNMSYIVGHIETLRSQAMGDPLHALLDWHILVVVVDENSWYPVTVQKCVAVVPCSLGVEVGL